MYTATALPAALLKLAPTLTDLELTNEHSADTGDAPPRIAPWSGLRRLRVDGYLIVVAPPTPFEPTIRNLCLWDADCDWDADLLAALASLHRLRVSGNSAWNFTEFMDEENRQPLDMPPDVFLPALRHFGCTGDMPLDKVLTRWPHLESLYARGSVNRVGNEWKECCHQPTVHGSLSKLHIKLEHPIMRAWRFPNLRTLECTVDSVKEPWAKHWPSFKACVGAAAAKLTTVVIRDWANEVKQPTRMIPPMPEGDAWTTTFPRLVTAQFHVSFERHVAEITAVLVRAPALTNVSVSVHSKAGMQWLSTLGEHGRPGGTFANLLHLHVGTPEHLRTYPLAYACLLRTTPTLQACHDIATFNE